MKRISLPMFVAVLAICMTSPSPLRAADYISTVENTPNLLGYWRFSNASQANSEVNGYTGTFGGHAAVGPAGSGPALAIDPANTPVSLDGTNGTFVNTSLVGQISNQGSIVGWFNLSALPSTVGHVLTIAGESEFGNDFDLQIDTDNVIRFFTEGGANVAAPTALSAANLNTWIFVAATFTANSDRNLYVNGNLVATNVPGGHSAGNGTFAIGESDVFTGRFFNGALDEIAVFNRDLTATEIANIYASRTAVPEPANILLLLVGGILVGCDQIRRRLFSAR